MAAGSTNHCAPLRRSVFASAGVGEAFAVAAVHAIAANGGWFCRDAFGMDLADDVCEDAIIFVAAVCGRRVA